MSWETNALKNNTLVKNTLVSASVAGENKIQKQATVFNYFTGIYRCRCLPDFS